MYSLYVVYMVCCIFYLSDSIKMLSLLLQFLFHLFAFAIGSSSFLVFVFYFGRMNSRLPR